MANRPVELGILFWTTFAIVTFNNFFQETIDWFTH